MRIPGWLILLAIVVLGVLLFSQVVAMMDMEPLPGDIAFDWGTQHIRIPVLYSLGAVAIVGLLIWFFRR